MTCQVHSDSREWRKLWSSYGDVKCWRAKFFSPEICKEAKNLWKQKTQMTGRPPVRPLSMNRKASRTCRNSVLKMRVNSVIYALSKHFFQKEINNVR